VWYGDIYRRGYDATSACLSFAPEAVAGRALPRSAPEGMRRTLLRLAMSVPGLGQVAANTLANDTYQFFHNLVLRCDTEERLHARLEEAKSQGRPIVLVAHSMGAMVSLGFLEGRNSDADVYDVVRFVTIGSQLGLQEVHELLFGTFVTGEPPVPRSIRTWTNLLGYEDPLGFASHEDFQTRPGSERRLPADVRVITNAARPHWIVGYLTNRSVATSIAKAWCAAFARPASAPDACGRKIELLHDPINGDSELPPPGP
jgi:pimeloyl-ACP methyl ester carboxylesterase